jgi:hypothetical protein
MAIHIVLPDTQVKPGVPIEHLGWAGQYVVDHFANKQDVTVIHLGDHWDFPSLSSYDRGTKAMEGRRVKADIEAGNLAFRALDAPLVAYNAKRVAYKEKQWWPKRVLLRGNHEDRLTRAVNDSANLDGFLSLDLCESPGWQVVPYLKPIEIDGVSYSHFFANPMTGRPYGGLIATRLKTIGHSFTMGHQQTLDMAIRYVRGVQQRGLVAGAFYLHDEDYKGYQGNDHFRGLMVCHDVRDGQYDLMEVSMDYLCRKYEGVGVAEFLRSKGHNDYALARCAA